MDRQSLKINGESLTDVKDGRLHAEVRVNAISCRAKPSRCSCRRVQGWRACHASHLDSLPHTLKLV